MHVAAERAAVLEGVVEAGAAQDRVTWPLAAFVAWSGLTLAWTGDLRQGSITLLFFFLPFGLLAIVLARLPWSRRGKPSLTSLSAT